tara:strand:- start:14211 stop:14600 length:390 start_codon:yes stop_codon:yes gene_type:complete
MSILYSLIESPTHQDFSQLYKELGLEELKINSHRKAIKLLKRKPPNWVVAEFFYGFGNNYAGVIISNLDVFLHSLQKYAPNASVIVFAAPQDFKYVGELTSRFNIFAVLKNPVKKTDLEDILRKKISAH